MWVFMMFVNFVNIYFLLIIIKIVDKMRENRLRWFGFLACDEERGDKTSKSVKV
jgi:hypothetical protein